MAFFRLAYLSASLNAPTPKTLQVLQYFGCMGSAWVVMIMESCRHKSFAQILNQISIWGLACMFVGPNLILSLYYTVNFPDGRPDSQEAILENEVLINYLPTWKALFFFIPFSLQHLPATYALSEEVRIHLAMIVCFWPAWLVGTAYLMQTRPNHDCLRSSTTRHSIMQRLRSGYVFSFYVAVVSHLGTVLWCLSLGETPGRAMYAMFVPPVPWAPHLTSNPQEFVFSVSKCAYAVSSAAMCVWALVAYLRTCEQQRRTSTGVTGVELKLLLILGIGGPYAVAMQLLIWRNDVLNDTQKN